MAFMVSIVCQCHTICGALSILCAASNIFLNSEIFQILLVRAQNENKVFYYEEPPFVAEHAMTESLDMTPNFILFSNSNGYIGTTVAANSIGYGCNTGFAL